MKVLSKVLFLVLVASLAYAVGTDSWVDADGFLQIPTTAISPDIDATLDAVWTTVPIIKCDIYTGEDPTPEGTVPDDYLDLTTEARAMWDANFFYFFGRVIDDEPAVGGDSWTNDSFEIYFDGDNSKTEGTTFDANDKQWRWVYMEATGNPDPGTSVSAWTDTDYGYDFELKISAADLAVCMPLEAGHEFGFEIQQNDRDAAARQHLSRWWHTSNLSWNTPSLFGNAVLNGDVSADEILNVYKTSTPFEIDGNLDDAWLKFPKIPQNTWVIDDGTYNFEGFDSYWYDCYMTFRVAWDDDYFYAYVDQADDINVVTSTSGDHTNDSVELYWDGDNSKTPGTTYDADCHQFRWVSDGVTGNWSQSTASVIVHDAGFYLEVAVPWAELAFTPEVDALFGFEVQTNDNDDIAVGRDGMGRWWSNSNSSWNTPSIFGTAVFAPAFTDAVENDAAQVENYDLAQNYPNPFNPTTTIKYAVRARENVRLTVFDMLGHQVTTLVNEVKNIGTYEVTFDAGNLASGNYFYKLEMGDKVITKKMTLLK